MKKKTKFKHARRLAWLMTACLSMTTIAPGFTAFAEEDYVNVSVSEKENSESEAESESSGSVAETETNGNAFGSEDTQNKAEDSSASADNESISADANEPDGAGESADTGESEDSGKSDDNIDTKDDIETSLDFGETEEAGEEDAADTSKYEADPTVDENETEKKEDSVEVKNDKPAGSNDLREDELTGDNNEEISNSEDNGNKEEVNNKKEEEEEEEEDAEDGELENNYEPVLVDATPSNAMVCTVDETGYPSITSACEAIKRDHGGSGTITLLSNDAENVVFDGRAGDEIVLLQITLDLNGYDLNGQFNVRGGADVTIKNGTVHSGKSVDWIYASGNDDKPTRFTLASDAVIEAADYGLGICGVTGSKDNNGSGFYVTIDGTVHGTGDTSAGIWLQGKMKNTDARTCDLIVNGSVISGYKDAPSIAINGWGNVTVNEGAEIDGATGIEIRAGSLTVNGGTVKGSVKEFSYEPNGDGSTSIGAGITINGHTTGLPVKVYIKGGSISGYYALAQIHTQTAKNDTEMIVTDGNFTGYDKDCAILISEYGNETAGVFSILGGTFTDNYGNKSDISNYLSSDCKQDENGMIVVEKPDISDPDDDEPVIDVPGTGDTGSEVKPDEGKDDIPATGDTGSEIKPDEGKDDIPATGDTGIEVKPDGGKDDSSGIVSAGNSGGKGHSGGGGGGGSFTRPVVSVTEYIGANGMKADWALEGRRFTKADGTHPSNEYLIINGMIYAFYTNGYAVSYENKEFYTEDVVPALEDIPVVEGTWELSGWWMQYSDGSYPRNDWAHLTHNGRSDWYYFDADGWMETGWKQIDGYWYYFGSDGAMLSSTLTPDGHTVDANGRMIA